MGRQAKLRQKRKQFKLSRPPIPELQYLESRLNSQDLRDWVVDQWNHSIDFNMFVEVESAYEIAQMMLDKLCMDFQSDLDMDSSVSYNLSPFIQLSVGINVYSWTVWAFVGDSATGIEYVTKDSEEFQLT